MVKRPPHRSNHDYVFSLAGILLLGLIVSVTKALLVPLALAVLLSFVLAPIVARLEAVGLRRGPAVLIVVCLAFGAIGGIGWATGVQVQSLAAEIPKHKREIRDKIDKLRSMHGGPIGDLLRMARELSAESDEADDVDDANPQPATRLIVAPAPLESSLSRIVQTAAPIAQPLATAGLVIVLVLFMLSHREDLRDRMIGLMGRGRIAHTTRMFGATANRLSHYLLAQMIVNAGVGLAYAVVIWAIGAPFAMLWGLLVAILRFVPFMGTWLAAACPLLLSVALFPGWGPAIEMFVAFVIINSLVSNFIEPLFMGRNTGVTPVALLVAAAFWTWIWGPIGLILSTPLTVCVVVLGQHVPRFRSLSRLLGGRETFAPRVRFYQRLLAGDPREAQHCLDGEIASVGLEAAYDRVVIPALRMARRDRRRGALSVVEEESLYNAARSILAACDSHMRESTASILPTGIPPTSAAAANSGPAPQSENILASSLDSSSLDSTARSPAHLSDTATVICCPAHHVSEELVARMLSSVLDRDGLETRTASSRTLPADILALVSGVSSPLLFISVLPPGGLPQARYLCKLIRQSHKDAPIIVGYWGNRKQFDRVLVSLRKAGASYVTTSLAQSRTQIEYLSRRKPASLSA